MGVRRVGARGARRNLCGSRRLGIAARALALSMAVEAIVAIRPVAAEPGDIFTVAAPAVTASAPKAADISVGDASVSSQTGALNYSFGIDTLLGRHGMQSHLSLAYSF